MHGLCAKKREQYDQAVSKAKDRAKRYKAENLLAAALTIDAALLHEMNMNKTPTSHAVWSYSAFDCESSTLGTRIT